MVDSKPYMEPDHEIIHMNENDIIAASTEEPIPTPTPTPSNNNPIQDIFDEIFNKS